MKIVASSLTKEANALISQSPLTLEAQAKAYGVKPRELEDVVQRGKRPAMNLVLGLVKATGWKIADVAVLEFKQDKAA